MIIRNAPAFRQFHPLATTDSVVLFTPRQIALGVDVSDRNQALIEIRAAESTIRGGRGPAAFLLGFDEFAFVQGAGSTANSIDLFESAYPSTTQFSGNAPVIQTTSPWDREGQAWETYQQAMAINPGTGLAVAPDHLVLQLPSWHLYKDHNTADTLPMWPGGPMFGGGLKPIIEFDGVLEAKKAANPESFAVEYDAQWRQNFYAYLSPVFVNRVFAPYQETKLAMATAGKLGIIYAGHGDPSLSQANFGFCIAHLEYDDHQIPHVVYDLIYFWAPKDFPGGVIDYLQIEDEIFEYAKAFMPQTLTFDQWNSAGVIQRLQANLTKADLPRRVNVSERFATKSLNWEVYEVFKTAIGHNIIHAPEHQLARAELEGLIVRNGVVSAPDLGDVRTKDVVDAMAHVTYTLIGEGAPDLFDSIARLQPRGSQLRPQRHRRRRPAGRPQGSVEPSSGTRLRRWCAPWSHRWWWPTELGGTHEHQRQEALRRGQPRTTADTHSDLASPPNHVPKSGTSRPQSTLPTTYDQVKQGFLPAPHGRDRQAWRHALGPAPGTGVPDATTGRREGRAASMGRCPRR
ncbi:MAG: hypothetical protein ACR2MB_09925, partial [Acidimicrobiales bacterium]